MKKWIVVLAVVVVSSSVACAVGVPVITAQDFQITEPVKAVQEAHWVWQLLTVDVVTNAILWILEGGVTALIGWLGLRGSKLARCILFIARGVRETFVAFVRPAKLNSENGKLTEDGRQEAMRQAIERSKQYARENGIELLKFLSKESITVIAEFCVRLFKGGKKAEVIIPLPDLSPSQPSAQK